MEENEEREIPLTLTKREMKKILEWGFFSLSQEDQELWRKLNEALILPK